MTPDAWFKVSDGAQFEGRLVGYDMFDYLGTLREVLFVELTRACSHAESNKKPVELAAGRLLGVGLWQGLSELVFYVESRACCSVKYLGAATDDIRPMARFQVEVVSPENHVRSLPLELLKREKLAVIQRMP